MADPRKRLLKWWQVFFMTIVVAAGFAVIVALKWDNMVALARGGSGEELTEAELRRRLLQCEPGTHQQNGMCVSNPSSAGTPAPSAPASPAPAAKTATK